MASVKVTAKKDFLEALATAKPLAALSEIIWNGFDADAANVEVFLGFNKLDGIESIKVRDDGYGIDFSRVDDLFGNLGDSWKKFQGKQNGRALHGKNGKGRFKAFALGEKVGWETTYSRDGKNANYRIDGTAQNLEKFEVTPQKATESKTGTEVVIENIAQDFRSLKGDGVTLELAKIFAAYLTEYPSLRLIYNGAVVDPTTAQSNKTEYHLGDVVLSDGKSVQVAITIIEWKIATDRAIHLCDRSGVSLHEIPAGPIRAPGFNFTIYIKSDHFRELDKTNSLILEELDPDVRDLVKAAKLKTKEHFRKRILEGKSQTIERWKRENIYPYEDGLVVGPVEIAERQVFDIIAVNVENYLPSFEDSDPKSKKFTFKLLAQAIKENPESVQTIIGEVLGLKKEAQDDLAQLLQKTSLSSIISSAKVVANRLDFLNGLENLLFDKETKEKLLERDQLHKILENEAWLFHEEFSLAGSEERLEDVLNKHLSHLGGREDKADDLSPVTVGDGKTGRIDLMLHKAVQPRTGEYDYLIVELKRPSKKVDDQVSMQIMNYAIAVADDERFHEIPARWTFIAISNEMTDTARRKANQRGKPKGLIYDDSEKNINVWVKTWSEIINDARARLAFVNAHLAYEANRESAKNYLRQTHEKFIPSPDSDESINSPLSDVSETEEEPA